MGIFQVSFVRTRLRKTDTFDKADKDFQENLKADMKKN